MSKVTHIVHVEFTSGGGYSHPRGFPSDKAAVAWAVEELDQNGDRIRDLVVTRAELFIPDPARKMEAYRELRAQGKLPRLYNDREVLYRWDRLEEKYARALCDLFAAMSRLERVLPPPSAVKLDGYLAVEEVLPHPEPGKVTVYVHTETISLEQALEHWRYLLTADGELRPDAKRLRLVSVTWFEEDDWGHPVKPVTLVLREVDLSQHCVHCRRRIIQPDTHCADCGGGSTY